MKKLIKTRRFGRIREQRKALFKGLVNALIEHEKITTTLMKAKELRPIIEKVITKARLDTPYRRRLVNQMATKQNTKKLFTMLATRYGQQPGGYTRIIKLGLRKKDGVPLAIIEFVQRSIAKQP